MATNNSIWFMDSTDKRRKTTSTFTVRKKVHFCTKLQLGKQDVCNNDEYASIFLIHILNLSNYYHFQVPESQTAAELFALQ